MPKVTVNSVQLYYELHGPEDADVLVLSNGILMSTTSWAFQTPVLSRNYRLLLYDCRGMWQSEHPPGPYSMELHADDLNALLDALDVESAHIGGTSYGAEISMHFALMYPNRTRSLIITSAVSEVDSEVESMINQWVEAARSNDPAQLFQAVVPLTFSESWIAANQALLDDARERYKLLDMDALLELLSAFSNLNLTKDLHKINAPALVAVGELDVLKPSRFSEIIANEIPDAEFATIPDAGHAALWENAEMFNSLILDFLVKHS
jgi:3-oxoadipate enol-lactonase